MGASRCTVREQKGEREGLESVMELAEGVMNLKMPISGRVTASGFYSPANKAKKKAIKSFIGI